MNHSIGSFTIVKNEAMWMGPHLESWLPVLDEVVLFDGGSTDGTLEIVEHMIATHPSGRKIKLFKDRDCCDLRDDYVRLFNECLRSLSTDLATFLHPDMIMDWRATKDLDTIRCLPEDTIAASMRVRSIGGEPHEPNWYELRGRADRWKNIYRLRNPDLGAHYYGHYGAANEDVYFSEITGETHEHFGPDFERYPYSVVDSGVAILHFSDVRPYERRLSRMETCLRHQGYSKDKVNELARIHPRVTLAGGDIVAAPLVRSEFMVSAEPFAKFYCEGIVHV